MAEKVGLKSFSRDLVADLCNLAAGGEIRPPSEYREIVKREVMDKLPEPGDWGYTLPDRSITGKSQEWIDANIQASMRYHQNVCDFLQTLDLSSFPGSSPLEQSMQMLKLLATQSGGQPSGEGESLPIFSEQKPEQVAEKLNSIMEEVESLDDTENELLSDEDSNSSNKSSGDEGLQKMQIAEDMLRGKEHILNISRRLDKLTRMKVSKSSKVEPDLEGEEVRQRPIKSFDEMSRIGKSEWALPSTYRTYRVLTHASPVRERVRRVEKKQLLYMLIDCSGSMSSGKRIASAGGVVFNRLKAVVAGEAEIYVRFFDTKLREEHHAATPAEAKKLMKLLVEKNFSGGGTDISGCAKAALLRIEEIVAQGTTAKPELVVVTDGDDRISIKSEDVGSNKLHAFVVESSNTALTELATRSGGVGINKL
jgi:uncharacterized protein with von Willebrand factor type A (vWA) domain